jgi:hypothetical protein
VHAAAMKLDSLRASFDSLGNDVRVVIETPLDGPEEPPQVPDDFGGRMNRVQASTHEVWLSLPDPFPDDR